MDESFLHFIWKFQQLASRELKTESGLKIILLQPGFKNTDAGPDFKNATIKIGDIVWNGNVEIHMTVKDWYRHNHQNDDAYDHVVLHVVWKNDGQVHRKDKTIIPTLELKNIVDEKLLLNYRKLFTQGNEILCNRFFSHVKDITILSMKDKALAQRLEEKSQIIFREIALTDHDWEEISWRLLSKIFGFKTNANSFYELAKSIPFKILKKESCNVMTIEALLFRQGGFLEEDSKDTYFLELKNEYRFKQKKYSLERRIDKHQWKFLRLRPANFPTIRIAQLSTLVASNNSLVSLFINYPSIRELKRGLEPSQSNYWRQHYNFGKPSKTKISRLGKLSVDNILINTIVPLQFAYGLYKDLGELKEKALELLASIKPEKNSITKTWADLGMEIKTAFDSQALIELYNQYCLNKRCLNCSIGVDLLSTSY